MRSRLRAWLIGFRVEHLDRLVAGAHAREREHCPDRAVRVLAAVLADAGRIAADVAGIRLGAVEGRGEQEDEALGTAHQVRADRVERLLGAARRREAGEDRPRLRERIDAAFLVLCRAERRAVVEVAAPIPLAVPGELQHRTEACDLSSIVLGAPDVTARRAQIGEAPEHVAEEEPEPHALAAAVASDPVHAVVPIAAPHERQAVRPGRDRVVDRPHAMLEERRRRGRAPRKLVRLRLLRVEQAPLEERDALVPQRDVAGHGHVARSGVGEPQEIVGAACARATPGRWMPPVLHVALDELSLGGAQQVLAPERRRREAERHDVLKLVAEAERTARLIVSAARPHPRAERLMEEPPFIRTSNESSGVFTWIVPSVSRQNVSTSLRAVVTRARSV